CYTICLIANAVLVGPDGMGSSAIRPVEFGRRTQTGAAGLLIRDCCSAGSGKVGACGCLRLHIEWRAVRSDALVAGITGGPFLFPEAGDSGTAGQPAHALSDRWMGIGAGTRAGVVCDPEDLVGFAYKSRQRSFLPAPAKRGLCSDEIGS